MDPATSARSRIGAVAWSLVFLVLGYVSMGSLAGAILGVWAARNPAIWESPVIPSLVQAGAGILIYGALTWLVGVKAMKMPAAELGLEGGRTGLSGFGRGFLLAFGLGLGAILLGLPAGSSWTGDGGTFGHYLGRLAVLLLVLLPPALMEEMAFRGTAVATMARGIGRGPAVVVTALCFSAAHRANPDVTVLALGNIALAGVFLGATFFARGGLWTATGAHLGWNVALAAAAASVSGLPFEIPWIDFRPGSPDWVTGGSFGPEGGLLATAVLAVGAVVVLRWRYFQEDV
jgi:membrane protease YdiL (CAAX protease family)